MSTRSSLALGAAIVAVVTAGWVWQVHRRVDLAQSAVSAANVERQRLETEIKRAEYQILTAESRRAESQAALDVLAKERLARSASVPANSPPPRIRAADTPAGQAAALQRFRAGLLLRYGQFYRALRLTPKQIAQFEDLMTGHQGRLTDIRGVGMSLSPVNRATAETAGATTNDGRQVRVLVDPAIAALRREEATRFETEQIALLGETGYAQLEEFNRGEDGRRIVRQLVSDLALSPNPLSPAQAAQLGGTLNELGFKGGAAADPSQWAAVLSRAQNFLAPDQLAQLQTQGIPSQLQVAMDELSRMIEGAKK